jgi:hypothetical protein
MTVTRGSGQSSKAQSRRSSFWSVLAAAVRTSPPVSASSTSGTIEELSPRREDNGEDEPQRAQRESSADQTQLDPHPSTRG